MSHRLVRHHKPVLYWNDWTNRAHFWHGDFPPLSHTVLKGNFGISNNQGTSLWDFVPNSGLGKFRHSKSIALSTTLVVVDGRACWRHLYDSRRVVAVYYKSVNCNPLTRSLRFVVQLVSTVNKFLTDKARRPFRLRYQNFLLSCSRPISYAVIHKRRPQGGRW